MAMKRFSIEDVEQCGYFLDIDIRFARFITRSSNHKDPATFLAAALVSNACGKGDVCLDIAGLAGRSLTNVEKESGTIRCPDLTDWAEHLRSNAAVGRPRDPVPLILDEKNRLYLYRYWEYENRLAADIESRAAADMPGVDICRLREGIRRLFPASPLPGPTDWQKVASVISVLKRFCVISGGPGTGKTFTVAKVLALLLEQGASRIVLAAPTGKAAARMAESITAAKARMDCPADLLHAIPTETYTLHRLLKPIPNSPYFRHHSDNPLPVDVLVVDEASMIDLALMSKLIQAIPSTTRLIVIGDKDQLSSVEAGSVLGDICNRATRNCFGTEFREKIASITAEPVDCAESADPAHAALRNSIVILENSHRFFQGSGIGAFSRAVNRGETDAAMEWLNNRTEGSVSWKPISSRNQLYQFLSPSILNGYHRYLDRRNLTEALDRLNRHKILCALNRGPFGAQAINRFVETELQRQGWIQPGRLPWYPGRPVLITRNDYLLSLFNGDIGIALEDVSGTSNQLLVYFQDSAGKIRGISPYRLPEHETVYAMTVHKSQGSEFSHVTLILPDKETPIVTRELIYTAITRARKSVTICGPEKVIRAAIAHKIDRTSGLRDRLWGE